MKFPYLLGSAPEAFRAWAKRLVDQLNRERAISDWPTFADDTAATAAGMKSRDGYVTPAGVVRRVL